jgi:hypothetical protein
VNLYKEPRFIQICTDIYTWHDWVMAIIDGRQLNSQWFEKHASLRMLKMLYLKAINLFPYHDNK